MANCYYGGGGADGNWNNASNWYSTMPSWSSSSFIPGLALGRIPNLSTDVCYIYDKVTTGPSSAFPGSLILGGLSGSPYPSIIAAGSYSGTVTCAYQIIPSWNFGASITGGTFSGSVTLGPTSMVSGGVGIFIAYFNCISGGTFNCPVNFQGGCISGGTFNKPVTVRIPQPRLNGTSEEFYYATYDTCNFFGGTYNLPITRTLTWVGNQPVVTDSTPDFDPGFAAGGGTYSPVITYVGFPDILGAGLF
jgi:hypothetical protein